jgi:hypothetical protein
VGVECIWLVHAIGGSQRLNATVVRERRDLRAQRRVAALERGCLLNLAADAGAELEHLDSQANDRDKQRAQDGNPGAPADDPVKPWGLKPQRQTRCGVLAYTLPGSGSLARRRLARSPARRRSTCRSLGVRTPWRGNELCLERHCGRRGAAGRPHIGPSALTGFATALRPRARSRDTARSRGSVSRRAGRPAAGDCGSCWWHGYLTSARASVPRADALTLIVGLMRPHPESVRSPGA